MAAIFVFTAHWGPGGLLGATGFFTRCVAGIVPTALIVAILANFSAALIHPVLWLCLVAAFACSVREFGSAPPLRGSLLKSWPLWLCGGGVLIANWPVRVFFPGADSGGSISIHFDHHFAYLSGIMTEMLTADYFSRLRISNFYPAVWSRYHFFNGAYQSSIMALVTSPTLLTYWTAQTVILTFILLSFGERFLEKWSSLLPGLLQWAAWLVLGFSLFSATILFNLRTSGALSLFGLVHFFFFLHGKKYRAAFLCVGILGVSVFRLVPTAFALGAGLTFWTYRDRAKLRAPTMSGNWFTLASFGLAVVYLFATLCFPDSGERPIWKFATYDIRWMRGLLAFSQLSLLGPWSGLLDSRFFPPKGAWPLLQLLSITFGAGLFLLLKRQRVKTWELLCAVGAAAIGIASAQLFLPSWSGSAILFVPYGFAAWFLSRGLQDRAVSFLIGLIFTGAVLFLFTGSGPVQAVAAGFVFEVGCWSLAGLLASSIASPRRATAALAVSFLFWLASNSTLSPLALADSPIITFASPHVSELGPDRLLKGLSGNPAVDDARAGLLGGRIRFNPANRVHFFSQEFILPGSVPP